MRLSTTLPSHLLKNVNEEEGIEKTAYLKHSHPMGLV